MPHPGSAQLKISNRHVLLACLWALFRVLPLQWKKQAKPKHLCQVALLCLWLIMGRIEDQVTSLWDEHICPLTCMDCVMKWWGQELQTPGTFLPALVQALHCLLLCWTIPGIQLEEQKDQTSSLFSCIRLLLLLSTAPRERPRVYFHVVSHPSAGESHGSLSSKSCRHSSLLPPPLNLCAHLESHSLIK